MLFSFLCISIFPSFEHLELHRFHLLLDVWTEKVSGIFELIFWDFEHSHNWAEMLTARMPGYLTSFLLLSRLI